MVKNGKIFQRDNLIFVFVAIFTFILFLSDPRVGIFIERWGKQGGLLSLFIAGGFYSLSVTSPVATAAIFFLGKVFNPLLIASVGAFGSLAADLLIFKFVKTRAGSSVQYLSRKFKVKAKNRKIAKYALVFAALAIIASPLPDELGVALLGALNIPTKRFIIYSYFLNFTGILMVGWLGSVL